MHNNTSSTDISQFSTHLGWRPLCKLLPLVNIHYMLINSPNCSTCLFSWYGLLIMVSCVGGDFSQTQQDCEVSVDDTVGWHTPWKRNPL